MSSSGSVTHWVRLAKVGDPLAARKLVETYYQRLVRFARQRLRGARRGMADEEDVALSAFDSFLRRAELGQFPRLDDRDDLWEVLLRITRCKAADVIKHENRQKRDAGRIQNEDIARATDAAGLDWIPDREPTPEEAVGFAEDVRRLLECLDDDLRQVALWKLDDCTNQEIAAKLNCVPRTVERKLRVIRSIWKREGLA